MPSLNRRNLLQAGVAFAIPSGMLTLLAGCGQSGTETPKQTKAANAVDPNTDTQDPDPPTAGEPMKVQYLEIVTPEVEAMCLQYSTIYDVTFGEANPLLGGARTAELDGGGMIGVRGPMRDDEAPVVRPYLLVDDIKAAVEAAEKAGAKVAMGPMEIPEQGQFAIVIHGGIDCGFWQL